ncbi:unnamed protein product, partial [Ceratitis capitata]
TSGKENKKLVKDKHRLAYNVRRRKTYAPQVVQLHKCSGIAPTKPNAPTPHQLQLCKQCSRSMEIQF